MASVLIVDDNTALAENIRDVLVSVGVSVVDVAENATQARQLFRLRPTDLAIIDIQLPDASGLELLAEFKALAPRSEFVVLTGRATVETAILAMRAGAGGLILKSSSPGELVATVEQALAKGVLRRERETFEQRYLALIHAADVFVVGLDPEASIQFVNAKFAAILGVDVNVAPGRSLLGVVDASDGRRLAAAIKSACGGINQELEIGLQQANEPARRVRFHLSAGGADSDAVVCIYGIGVDVTERRALERRAAASEALNAMAPLALGLAHEIRNPLNAAVLELHLLGRAIDRLSDEQVRSPMRRRVGVVEAEIRRLERLLTEFLELARPRTQRKDQVALASVVDEVLELEREATLQAKVEVLRMVAEPGFVVGDVEKLKQVVLNLVVNALDAMPDGGTLTASVSVEGEHVRMRVEDTGPGIDPQIMAEVFDPFFTTKPAGTGLGLAIVRKIIEQHSGKIELIPGPSGGTVAEVRLPRLGMPTARSDQKAVKDSANQA